MNLSGTPSGTSSVRPSGRARDAMREVTLEPGWAGHAEGSCLVRFGGTHVLCAASVIERVPPFLRNGARLGDRGIRHAAALDPQPHRPEGRRAASRAGGPRKSSG